MKRIKIGMLAASVVLVTGCSTVSPEKVNAFLAEDQAYAVVEKVYDANTSDSREHCKKKDLEAKLIEICSDLSNFDMVYTVIYADRGVFFNFYAMARRPHGIKAGNIVAFAPRSGYVRRVVTTEHTSDCGWTGRPLEMLHGKGLYGAAAFAAGMLIVPTIVTVADPSVLRGGVECEGWSYKKVIPSLRTN